MEATGHLVGGVRDNQWADPTSCTEWNVRQLVNHLVGGDLLFTGILGGRQLPDPEALARHRSADHLGDDPAAAYGAAAAGLLEAFRRPGVMEEVFTVPIGALPGRATLHLRTTETLVHGWDLAQATVQPVRFPDDVVRQELEFTRARLPDLPPTRRPFAPPQPVPDDAAPIDRLAALLGRPVPGGKGASR